jgi:2-polyprenyl-3-methyl-5-hydroxy-6-metoxy-1,4-benzoquinol methylase
LKEALDKIAQINHLLGGNKLTLQSVKILLKNHDKSKRITIADVGCGNGDMLREIADFGLKNNYDFNLVGFDANIFTIEYARELSKEYKNINFVCQDIFTESFNEIKYDIVLCTLTLHHFKNNEIKDILKIFHANSSIGTVINDLHRSKAAYYLFQIVGVVFGLNEMSKQDGSTSILRGFKRQDLVDFCKLLNLKKYSIHWRWAFRYQWIIEKG